MRPGRHSPLGATFDGEGVNFAVYSERATGIDLCLFDERGREQRLPLPEMRAHVFHGYAPGLRPGQRYGFRAHGRWAPAEGLRFNPNKLLVDPYARAISGALDYRAPVFPFAGSPAPGVLGGTDAPADDLVMDPRDDASGVPKSVVVDSRFNWALDSRPRISWADTVLYEAHVRGLTMTHPDVPRDLRGTYLGLASDPIIAHLQRLGVTTLELLPVHEHADEWSLAARGMKNYWGYSTLGFFAPDQRFAAQPGRQVDEFKEMVRRLHAAGIEVVLDVVYNHTCEGDWMGPMLSLRGLDNTTYYRLKKDNRRLYDDFTGCGNSLNMLHPQTLKLVMDSLRYWVTEMHVDGFRFDLASTLAREVDHVDKMSAFFDIIHQDPVLSDVKLIAEPWDLGDGGYQVGNFPVLWTEWNAQYRDCVRHYWTGDRGRVGELASRLSGSSDLYDDGGRRPHASINFITAHDGFTLADLVSYEKKRNLENGEDNRDGWDHNASWNCGAEGETTDPEIRARRARQVRNFLLTLAVSQGVPMITAGDELGKTQHGNNNAFVQDNETSWLDWALDDEREDLLAFASELFSLRMRHPVFRRPRFLIGKKIEGSELQKDIAWFHPTGREMNLVDWQEPACAALGMLVAGDALGWLDDDGAPVMDDTFLVWLNGDREPCTVTMPDEAWGARWRLRVDTSQPRMLTGAACIEVEPGESLEVLGSAALILKRVRPGVGSWRPSGFFESVSSSE